MSEGQTINRRRQRMITLGKITGAGLLLVLLAMLIPFTVMVIQACLTPTPPEAFPLAATRLLQPENSAPNRQAGHAAAATTHTLALQQTDLTTSHAAVAGNKTMLTYPEFIRDLPDLPPKLRPLRDRLNRQYDRLLRDVAEYEAAKERLTAQEQKKKLDAIDKQSKSIWGEINKATGNSLTMVGAQELMERRNQEYLKWIKSAMIENAGKRGNWKEAARHAKDLLGYLKWEWREPRLRFNPNEPVFDSDFYRQMGTQDWKRIIYCYRQTGGGYGYVSIVSMVYDREKERAMDFVSRFVWECSRR